MALTAKHKERQLTAILVAPDRDLAAQFMHSVSEAKTFQVLAELKSYPPRQTLDIRLRQLKPEVVLLDVASDETAACDLIAFIVQLCPETHVIGLHRESAADAIVKSLRAGATEFLHAPFDAATQREAVARLLRLSAPDAASEPELGQLAAFSSVKPGAGASTIATQTALAAASLSGKRILLADLDLTGGLIAFYLKLNHSYSAIDALQQAEALDAGAWAKLTARAGSLDVLCAPPSPVTEPIDATRFQAILESARTVYEYVIVDLPAIFERISLLTISQADRAFLVSTSELPSLHLARKATTMLDQLGFPKERFKVIANRTNRRDGITAADMEKLFNRPVHASLPNDYFSLHRTVALGQPLALDGELGRAISGLAAFICGHNAHVNKSSGVVPETKLAFSML
jgi:pilus assembly protein CpaE